MMCLERRTRVVRLSILASVLALLILPVASLADETLVLELPSFRSPVTTSPPPPGPETAAPKSERSAPKTSSRRGKLPSRQGDPGRGDEKVVGRLGVANQLASIWSNRRTSRRLLAQVQPGTYLALTHDMGDWYGVLMSDRSTGWILKSSVQILDYEVLAPDTPQSPRYSGYTPGLNDPLLTGGQRALLQIAYSYLGVPYKFGGTAVTGLDCSAFVQRCFAALGIRLPRTAREQFNIGFPLSPEQLQAGDRLYFASRDGSITHTGIYIGSGYFIHASSSRKGVAISNLSETMYQNMYAGARR
jgi:cell wall-associated NlpC family hydrolase